MNQALEIQLFKREDFPEYRSWFQDPALNEQLGPMEEEDEWLTYVLKEQEGLTEFEGCTYSVFKNKFLVAVIGLTFPDRDHPRYGITSIAVKPVLRGQGIGKRILKKIMELHPLKNGQYWIAWVDKKNPHAKLFFENNGWRCVENPTENNDMFLFEIRDPS